MIILTCPPRHAQQQTVYALVEKQPSVSWPDDSRPLDQPEQDHPSHEDPSPMYRGVFASNINFSNTASVSADSGASGYNPYTTVATTWLPVDSPLVVSTRDLDHGERFQPPWAAVTNIAPDTKKHLANPSKRKMFEGRLGKR